MPSLDMAGLAERLNLPVGWVREKVAKREIPFRRLGKHVRFEDDDVAAILADAFEPPKTVPTRGEVAAKRATARRTA